MGTIDDEVGAGLLQATRIANPDTPILFQIDSDGGDALLSMAVAHDLQKRFTRVETHAVGVCASAAVHLLQGGQHRTATPYTAFYTHELYASQETLSHVSAQGLTRQFALDVRNWAAFMQKRCGKSVRYWRDFFNRERWFGAKEAKRLGLIDTIV